MFLLFNFIVYFLKYMKDEVKIYDKLDKNINKKFTISTISTKTYYFTLFYITNNIKIFLFIFYYLLFSTIYTCPHFYTKT